MTVRALFSMGVNVLGGIYSEQLCTYYHNYVHACIVNAICCSPTWL